MAARAARKNEYDRSTDYRGSAWWSLDRRTLKRCEELVATGTELLELEAQECIHCEHQLSFSCAVVPGPRAESVFVFHLRPDGERCVEAVGHADSPTRHCRGKPGPLSFEIDDVIDRADREKVLETAKTSGSPRCFSNFRLSPANGLLVAQYQGASSCKTAWCASGQVWQLLLADLRASN